MEGEVEVALRRAATLIAQHRWQDAIAQLEPVLVTHPDDPRLWTRLSLAQANEPGCLADSLVSADRALFLVPDDPEALRTRAVALVANEQYWQALGALQRAAQLAPEAAATHLMLARVQDQLFQPHEALGSARRGVELEPGDPQGHIQLAEVLLHHYQHDERRLQEARKHVAIAAKLDPKAAEMLSAPALAALDIVGPTDQTVGACVDAGERLERWSQQSSRWVGRGLLLVALVLVVGGAHPRQAALQVASVGLLGVWLACIIGWFRLGDWARLELAQFIRDEPWRALWIFRRLVGAWVFAVALTAVLAWVRGGSG